MKGYKEAVVEQMGGDGKKRGVITSTDFLPSLLLKFLVNCWGGYFQMTVHMLDRHVSPAYLW